MRRSSIHKEGSSTQSARQGSDENAVEAAAVRLLARREHSTEELKRKLLAKGYPAASVAAVVAKLGGKRLVSDDRFVAGFVHHHAKRGQGPVRIRIELRHQGIADPRIEQEFASAGIDWGRLAAEVRQRKFGATLPRGPGERAKQARFLQYRGFNADQIRAALSSDISSSDTGPDMDFDSGLADRDITSGVDPDP